MYKTICIFKKEEFGAPASVILMVRYLLKATGNFSFLLEYILGCQHICNYITIMYYKGSSCDFLAQPLDKKTGE